MERLTKLALESKELESAIVVSTIELGEKQAKLDKILRDLIPTIMDELGMSEFKLKDGSVISVKNDVKCGITEEHKEEAFTWLAEKGFDGIVKTKVMTEFGKGEMERAKAALRILMEAGFGAIIDRNIHHMTLKSFVKERLEKGDNIPIETFGIFEFKQAKVTTPKQKR
jgi:hypothetical protein